MMYPSQEKIVGNQAENHMSDKDTVVPQEKERVYVIDHLNISDPAVESQGDSELLLAHCS